MRVVTIVATAVVAMSTAALAQVARTPVEQKNAPPNAMAANGSSAANATDAPDPQPGDATATPAGGKTEPASPQR